MAAPKIAVYSIPDLKNTTDDALPNYLNSLKFKQSHFLADVRLILGYSAVVIAAVTFAADYKLGWDATKAGTFWAVLVYFALNGALTLWIWGVERGKVYIGERNQSLLSISSSVKKHSPIYNLTVRQQDAKGKEETLDLAAPFTRWFDADGYFVAKPFQQWLATEIPLVSQADPKNVLRAIQEADGEATLPSSEQRDETLSKKSQVDDISASTRSRKSRKQ